MAFGSHTSYLSIFQTAQNFGLSSRQLSHFPDKGIRELLCKARSSRGINDAILH